VKSYGETTLPVARRSGALAVLRYSRSCTFEKPHFESGPDFISLTLSNISGDESLVDECEYPQTNFLLDGSKVAVPEYRLVFKNQRTDVVQPFVRSLRLGGLLRNIVQHPDR